MRLGLFVDTIDSLTCWLVVGVLRSMIRYGCFTPSSTEGCCSFSNVDLSILFLSHIDLSILFRIYNDNYNDDDDGNVGDDDGGGGGGGGGHNKNNDDDSK